MLLRLSDLSYGPGSALAACRLWSQFLSFGFLFFLPFLSLGVLLDA